MAFVLTLKPGSNVSCGHGVASSVTTVSAAKLQVNGLAVLTKDSVEGKPVVGCATVPSSDASGPIDVTCTLVNTVTAGESVKLLADGKPVLLDTLKGETNGMVSKLTPQKKLSGSAAQNKVTAT